MTSRVSTTNIDSLNSFNPSGHSKPKETLRRGTWTVEEEQYVACLIEEFKQGHIPLKEGMSLRCFLAKMVHCNPKRISKKFEGSNYNGKQLYEQSDKDLDPTEALERRTKLQALEDKFEDSVTALRAAEDSRGTGIDSSLRVDSINLFPSSAHHRSLLSGAAAGLSGSNLLGSDTSWLRAALANPGGMSLGATAAGLGLGGGGGGLNSLGRGLDHSTLLAAGLGSLEPNPLPMGADSLGNMARFSNSRSSQVGVDVSGESSRFKNSLSDPSLAVNIPPGISMASLQGGPSAMTGGLGGGSLQASIGFPSLPGFSAGMGFSGGTADGGLAQDILHQQLMTANAPAGSANHEDNTRRRLMNLLSQPSSSEAQIKRNSLAMMGAQDVLSGNAKKRRFY
ncbi:expressed unknown protein [Seminavis robusta]|uniref:Uncharacterized protein n=1 Tax=Seminavis robusta TaxID=568900 RepID=A0A9N8DQR3_9STRA|nr:expressed unknown protein [Seminavis robusta]|eukprot:Sro288_g108730.1 n/a (395) ;mRNA; f:12524-13708